MSAVARLLSAIVRSAFYWVRALLVALLVQPLALLSNPLLRHRGMSREDATVAAVGFVLRAARRVYSAVAYLLGTPMKRLGRNLVWTVNEFTVSPLGLRLLAGWGFEDFHVDMEEARLGGGFIWTITRIAGPCFQGRLWGDFTWCQWETLEERVQADREIGEKFRARVQANVEEERLHLEQYGTYR